MLIEEAREACEKRPLSEEDVRRIQAGELHAVAIQKRYWRAGTIRVADSRLGYRA
jgi:hypothetical protein